MNGVFIIGVQKGGTTSLYNYLSEHPNISVSIPKETEYFINSDNFSKNRFISKYFTVNKETKIVCEASPQYFFNKFAIKNIKSIFPNAKIILLLRNPIDRTYSHFRMSKRRNIEIRTFNQVLESNNDKLLFDSNDIKYGYIGMSIYFANLLNWIKYFGIDNVKVAFTEDLEKNTSKVVKEIFLFLNLKTNVKLSNINKRYHKSGSQRFKKLRQLIKRSKRIKILLKTIIGERNYNKIYFILETEWGVKKTNRSLTKIQRLRLKLYFDEDVELIQNYLKIKTPWDDFK